MVDKSNGPSYVWISSSKRAFAAILAGLLVFIPITIIEIWGPWKLLGDVSLKKDAPQTFTSVASLAWAAKENIDVVLLVGGSTSRELTASDAHISRLLTQRCGHSIRFINAGTSSQNLLESWQLTDALASSQRKLVIVGFNHLRFEGGRKQVYESTRKMLLPFAVPDQLKNSLSEFYFSNIPSAFNPKGIAWIIKGINYINFGASPLSHTSFIEVNEDDPYHTGRNLYKEPPLPSRQKEVLVSHMIAERLPIYRTAHVEAVDLWKLFIRNYSSANSKVLFLGLPVSPEMRRLNDATSIEMRQDLIELQNAGALIADWRIDHFLSDADFYDQQHLLSSGRKKLDARFVDLVVKSTPGCSK